MNISDRLNEIQARADAATPGWKVTRGNVGDYHPLFIESPLLDGRRLWTDADTLFAGHARSDIPALVAARGDAAGRASAHQHHGPVHDAESHTRPGNGGWTIGAFGTTRDHAERNQGRMSNETNNIQFQHYSVRYLDTVEVADSSSAEPTTFSTTCEISETPREPENGSSWLSFGTTKDHGLRFRVLGLPAPQGSKRHVGRGRLVESSKLVKPWRQDVAAAALEARAGREPLEGPTLVCITFYLPRPKSAPKRRIHPDRKPDLDKLCRSTLDALVTAGAIRDDAQVVQLVAVKQFASPAFPMGADVLITTPTGVFA